MEEEGEGEMTATIETQEEQQFADWLSKSVRYYGSAGVRKAKKLAEKHGYPIEIIEHANGCTGCYARTDAVVTVPIDDYEMDRLARKVRSRILSADAPAKILAIVPEQLLVRATNIAGRCTISIDDLNALGIAGPARPSGRVELNLVLKYHYPELQRWHRYLIYHSIGSVIGEYSWAIPDPAELVELQALLDYIK